MRVAIIGAGGQLAYDLLRLCGASGQDTECVGLRHDQVEVTNWHSVEEVLDDVRPDVVINTAAFHQVEACEADPRRAFEVNTRGAFHLALACRARGLRLVHMSSDYVFSGDKGMPYQEGDCPDPVNAYGASKAAGEIMVRAHCPQHFIVRTSALFGAARPSGKGENFVQTMIRKAQGGSEIRVVDDQVTCPTFAGALARQIMALVSRPEFGTYHAVCHGACSWFEFAKEIFRQTGIAANLKPQKTAESTSRVRRPLYSVLRNSALEHLGLDMMPTWQQALAEYLGESSARS